MNYIAFAKIRQFISNSFAMIHFCALFTQRLRTGDERDVVLSALLTIPLIVP